MRNVTRLWIKSPFQSTTAASPPDVRQGYALPVALPFTSGLCPRFGLRPKVPGPKAEPGAQPQLIFLKLTARHSLASHRAAKPGRAMTSDLCAKRRASCERVRQQMLETMTNESNEALDKESISISDCGFVPKFQGQRPNRGTAPTDFFEIDGKA